MSDFYVNFRFWFEPCSPNKVHFLDYEKKFLPLLQALLNREELSLTAVSEIFETMIDAQMPYGSEIEFAFSTAPLKGIWEWCAAKIPDARVKEFFNSYENVTTSRPLLEATSKPTQGQLETVAE